MFDKIKTLYFMLNKIKTHFMFHKIKTHVFYFR